MSRRPAVACVAAGAVGFVAVYAFFVRTAAGQRVDARLDAHHLVRSSHRLLAGYNRYVAIGELAAVVALLLFAVARDQLRRGVLCAAMPVVAVVVADVLKPTLARPRLDTAVAWDAARNTFPSGHVGFAAATVAAFVLVVPVALRPLVVALGLPAVGAVMVAVVLAHWHRASDGIGALFLVLALSGVVVLLSPAPRDPRTAASPAERERALV